MSSFVRSNLLTQGLSPIVSSDTKILVLGTLPGAESIKREQYYANSRNDFWSIMEELFGIGGRYEERLQGLADHRIGIWDVLERAERAGSRDSKILKGSEIPNDFGTLFLMHPSIETVVFNGHRAERYFHKCVLSIRQPRLGALKFHPALPSTSPANTHATFQAKVDAWRALKAPLTD